MKMCAQGNCMFFWHKMLRHQARAIWGINVFTFVCVSTSDGCVSRLQSSSHFKMYQQHPSGEVQRHIRHTSSRNKDTHAPYRTLLKAVRLHKPRGIPWIKLSRPEPIYKLSVLCSSRLLFAPGPFHGRQHTLQQCLAVIVEWWLHIIVTLMVNKLGYAAQRWDEGNWGLNIIHWRKCEAQTWNPLPSY